MRHCIMHRRSLQTLLVLIHTSYLAKFNSTKLGGPSTCRLQTYNMGQPLLKPNLICRQNHFYQGQTRATYAQTHHKQQVTTNWILFIRRAISSQQSLRWPPTIGCLEPDQDVAYSWDSTYSLSRSSQNARQWKVSRWYPALDDQCSWLTSKLVFSKLVAPILFDPSAIVLGSSGCVLDSMASFRQYNAKQP